MINVDSNELQKLYIAYFGRPGDPSGIKYLLKLINICSDSVRLPLVKITENTKKEVEKALKVAKLIDE